MPSFGHSKFLPVFSYQKGLNKFGMHILGHSEFLPVLLGKIVGKNLEQPFLAILNLYQSFGEKVLEKIQNGHFWPFQIYISLFGKNCQKKFGMAIFGCSKFFQSFWENIVRKFGMAIFGHSEFIPVILGKIVRKKFKMAIFGHPKFVPAFLGKIVRENLEWPFWPF